MSGYKKHGAPWRLDARTLRLFVIVLAVSLQIQATLPFGVAGIRVAVSDIVLPIFILAAFLGGAFHTPGVMRFRIPGTLYWLGGLIAVLTVSLFIGYANSGEWSRWALVNKWLGGVLLVGYFLAGCVIVRLGGHQGRDKFLAAFIFFALIVAAVNGAAMPLISPEYTLPVGIKFSRATGFMDNANAYGFLLVVALLLAITQRYWLWFSLPALTLALWFTSSRGALFAFLTGFAVVAVLDSERLRGTARPLVLGCLLIALFTGLVALIDHKSISNAVEGYSPIGFLSKERFDTQSYTIMQRREQTGRAAELIAEAPVFGQGLGFFIRTTGQTLHNSLLWLVLETGIVGAVVFTIFLSLAVRRLFLDRADPIALGMLAVSGAFAVMSLTGEYLYQRHLWVLLGVALAWPPESQEAA